MDLAAFTRPAGALRVMPPASGSRSSLSFIPDRLPPQGEAAAIATVVGLLSEADQAIGELVGIGRILPNPDLLVRPYLRQEAVASSAIEGTQATFSDLVAFEARQAPPPGSDVRDVANYSRALEQALRSVQDGAPIDADLVRRIHRTLMTGARGEAFSTPGEFRTIQNHIDGGREPADGDFVPPPPAEMQTALADLFAYLSIDVGSRPPVLVEAAWVHYQFEAIHPFIDGNGRVGRVLIPLLIAQRRRFDHPLLYLSPYFRQNRTLYNDLLFGVSAQSHWERWLQFFLEAVVTRARQAISLSDEVIALGQRWHEKLNTAKASPTAHKLCDYVHQHLAITAWSAERHLEVTPPSVYNAIRTLEGVAILTEVTGRSRDRYWVASELLRMLDAGVAGNPPAASGATS